MFHRVRCLIFCCSPAFRIRNGNDGLYTGINSGPVHVDNTLAFIAIRRDDGILQFADCQIQGDNVSQFEEGRLHDHVDTAAETDLLCNGNGVDNVEFDMVLGNTAFQGSRQFFFQFSRRPRAVQEECAAFFDALEQIEIMYIGLTMAGNKVGLMNQIGHADRFFTKAQVRYGYTAGFLGVIGKIPLCIEVRIVTDNFDSRFIGANSTVRAKAPELAGMEFFLAQVDIAGSRQRKVGYVVDNAEDEMIFRFALFEVIEAGNDISRQIFFTAQAKAAGINLRCSLCRSIRSSYTQVNRITISTRFFRTVQNGNAFYRLRQSGQEVSFRPRAEEVDIETAYFTALGNETADSFFGYFGTTTHDDDNVFCIRCTCIIEEMIFTACNFLNFLHIVFDHIRNGIVEFITRF